MEKILKKVGWSSIVESILFLVLGIILICKPEGTLNFISKILGITFLVIGAFNIINYIKTQENILLIGGIMSIVIGIIALFYMGVISSIFRIIIGAWIIYTSIVRITSSVQIRKINSRIGNLGLILAIIMLCCGIYTIFSANAIIVTIGVIMVIYSVIDLIENIIFVRNVKKLS